MTDHDQAAIDAELQSLAPCPTADDDDDITCPCDLQGCPGQFHGCDYHTDGEQR